ncbi:hypothetical protein MMC34_005849 [Xylographa carneopallida]|nr:hypothetical protein [Xylographa carneopallida]
MAWSSSKYVSPSLASIPVQIDPSAAGTTIRWALAAEAGINALTSAFMIFKPSTLLQMISVSSSSPDPVAAAMLQWLGGLTLALIAPLLLAFPNTKSGIESRPVVYATLLSMEVALLPLITWQAMTGHTLSSKSLVNVAATFIGPILWRLWILWYRPELMGRYTEDKKGT